MTKPNVTINFYFEARKIIGKKTITVQGEKVREALQALLEMLTNQQKQELFTKVFTNKNFETKKYNILVNGRNIKLLNYLDTTLSENDEITIVPAIGGGNQ